MSNNAKYTKEYIEQQSYNSIPKGIKNRLTRTGTGVVVFNAANISLDIMTDTINYVLDNCSSGLLLLIVKYKGKWDVLSPKKNEDNKYGKIKGIKAIPGNGETELYISPNRQHDVYVEFLLGRKDLELVCKDCGRRFVFSIGEQNFFQEHRLDVPKRCKACRKREKKGGVTTLAGIKNPIGKGSTPNGNQGEGGWVVPRFSKGPTGRKCGECSLFNKDKCSYPTNTQSNAACEDFVSKAILPEDMEKNFPKQGEASSIRLGGKKMSQFERAKYESND